MKKRLVSALLLVCMLVTLIPTAVFPASASTDLSGTGSSQSTGSTADSYDDLYVGADGSKTENGGELTVLLKGFKNVASYDLTAGQWTNVAPGATKHATIAGAWTEGAKGGIGYDLAAADYSRYLSLDSSLLPTDAYTLEIVASVRGLTVNADGVTVPEAATQNNPAGFSLGRFRAFFWFGSQSANNRKLNSFVHMVTETETTTVDNWNQLGVVTGNWNGTTNIWQGDTSIITAGITLTSDTASGKYVYTFAKNGANATPTSHNTCPINANSVYQGSFILFRSVPGTVYGVRLYTKALTEAEVSRNRAIDILLYVGAPFSLYAELNDADKETFLLQVSKQNMDVTVAELEDIIDQLEEIRAQEEAARKKTAYDALYIGADGTKTENGGSLTMLLSAYDTASTVFAGESGVWYDKMGNHNANFIGSVWGTLTGGGVGYTVTINPENATAGTKNVDAYLDIGGKALPKEDYTLETVVKYGYPQEIDADGNIVGEYEGAHLATTVSDALGQFKAIYERGTSTTLGGAHYVRWFISPAEGGWQTGKYLNTQLWPETSRADRGIYTQQIVRDLTVTADEVSATFRVFKNGSPTKSGSFVSTGSVSTYETGKGTTLGYKYYTDADSDSAFYLFRRTPVAVYSVRLYDAILTEYEFKYNHFVDLLAYAGVDASACSNLSAEELAFVVDAFALMGFMEKSELEAALEETVSLLRSDWNKDESLYVTDGLVVLLSAYDGFSTGTRIDAENGVIWTNAVKAGTYGTLVGAGWYRNEDGGLRIRETVSQADADAKKVNLRTRSGADFYLDLDYSLLPAEDYTIETVLSPEGITVEDEQGNITWYTDDYSTYGRYYERAFILGAFRCMGFACYSHNANGNMERRWLYQSEGGWDDYKPLPARVHVGTDKALGGLTPGQIINYTIKHDLIRNTETDALSSQYTILGDGNVYMNSGISSDMYIAKDDVKDQRFNIWRGLASTMYSVRVYDRLLTEDEMLQNRVADICYYFNLDVSMLTEALASISDKNIVFKAFSMLSFDMTKEEAQSALDNAMAGIWVRTDGVAIKGDMSDAIRFYFTLQYPAIAAIMAAGFKVELGTLVNVGKDENPVANGAYDYRFVAFNSVSGINSSYFLDEDTYAVTLSYQDADRELYNEKIRVVSYVKLTDAEGTDIYFYSGLGNSAYDTDTSLFTVYKYLKDCASIAEEGLTDYLAMLVKDCYYDEIIYFDSYAEGTGDGSKDAPYTNFNDAFDACKEILTALDKPTNVTLFVEGGIHRVSQVAELDFGEISYSEYTFNIEGNYEADEAPELTTALDIPIAAFKAVEGKDGLYVFEFAPDAEGNYPKFRNLYVYGMTADLAHSTPTTTAYGEFPFTTPFDRDMVGTFLKAEYYYDNGVLAEHAPAEEFKNLPGRTDLLASYTKHYEWFLALSDLKAKYRDLTISNDAYKALTVEDVRSGMGTDYAEGFAHFHEELCKAKDGEQKLTDVDYTLPAIANNADRTGVFYLRIEMVEALRATVEAKLAAMKEAGTYVAGESEKLVLQGSGLELHAHANWDYNIIDVDGIDFDDVAYYYDERHNTVDTCVAVYANMEQYAKFQIPSGNSMANRYVFLRNALEFVDKEGEYYYDVDNGKLYYYTEQGLDGLTVSYPTMENLLVFREARNLTISDLTIWGLDDYTLTRIGMAASQAGANALGDGLKLETSFSRRAAIAMYNAYGVTIQDCYIHDIGGAGIYMEGRVEDTLLMGNELEMIGDSGIRIRGYAAGNNEFSYRSGAERVTITQNYLHEIAQSIYNAPALYMASCKDVEIYKNTIIGCNYSGMSLGWSWSKATWEEHGGYNLYNVNIHHNYITDFMQFLSDGGAIYVLGGNLKPDNPKQINFMHHNYVVFSDTTGNGLGGQCDGYYFDGSSTNWSNYNNILVEQSAGADRGDKPGASDRDYALYMRRKGSHYIFKQHTTTGSAWSYNIHSTDNFIFNVRATSAKTQQSEVFSMGKESQWQACGHKVVGTRYFYGENKLAFSAAIKAQMEECGSHMHPGEWEWLLSNEY